MMLDILYMQKYTLGVKIDSKLHFGRHATKKEKQELKERLIKEKREAKKKQEKKIKQDK